jgi:hypothetical protein
MLLNRNYIVAVTLFLSVLRLSAQPGHPGDGPVGGVRYLLLAGIGLAFVSLRKKK